MCLFHNKPYRKQHFFAGLESFQNVLETFKRAKYDLGEVLSSCELIDALSLDVVTSNSKAKSPIENYPFYMLIETQGSNGTHDEEKMTRFLTDVMDAGIVKNGVVTNEPSKMKVKE